METGARMPALQRVEAGPTSQTQALLPTRIGTGSQLRQAEQLWTVPVTGNDLPEKTHSVCRWWCGRTVAPTWHKPFGVNGRRAASKG